jgi:hypothetical protein
LRQEPFLKFDAVICFPRPKAARPPPPSCIFSERREARQALLRRLERTRDAHAFDPARFRPGNRGLVASGRARVVRPTGESHRLSAIPSNWSEPKRIYKPRRLNRIKIYDMR